MCTNITSTDEKNFTIRVTLTKQEKSNSHPYFSAVFDRETNRKLSNGKSISQSTITEQENIAKQCNYTFNYISGLESLKKAGKILGKVDIYRTKIIKHHNRMMVEVRWSDEEAQRTKDGIDIKTMELPGNVAKMLELLRDHPLLVKSIPNTALEKSTQSIIEHSSHLCCISSKEPLSPQLIFDAGKVSEKVWLHATLQKLAFCPWSVLTFFTMSSRLLPQHEFTHEQEDNLFSLEKQFKELLKIQKAHTPILIFRLSYAEPPTARALRLDWKQFTTLE